ncbi:MAG: nitrogenase iron-molybdenum cofactor biosynthesis protein NifN [SAR324 cluster bacterium]|nr:nitrogenase iron-molybdenum cofactor biosynthesis protein NifN [SAR324 cluster bacterium]
MSKNLITNPLRLSQPAGAALAYMGIRGAVPLWHGVQGCTAFAKILMLGHFREPVPYQTTAMGHGEIVMGGEANIFEAIKNIKDEAELVALLTTGVSETSGCDIQGILIEARDLHPTTNMVGVSTPDFQGSLETGYAKAVKALIKQFVKPAAEVEKQVAVLIGPYFTPAEVGKIKDTIKNLGWKPFMLPDLSESLIGRLLPEEHSPGAIGGLTVEELSQLGASELVVSIGSSMHKVAGNFAKDIGAEYQSFDHLALPDEIDAFFKLFLKGAQLPEKYLQQRQHLLDMMLDVESLFYSKKAAIAGDPELIHRMRAPLEGIGIETFCISGIPCSDSAMGDLHDLEELFEAEDYHLLLGNSWAAKMIKDKETVAIPMGMPVFGQVGGHRKQRCLYWGAANLFEELANGVLNLDEAVKPYHSKLKETLLKNSLLGETA